MPNKRAAGTVRIIGGRWRGRRVLVHDKTGLRPTPDRIRETLFNWLSPQIRDARCLDLFAGTGALGFEAASRGAAEVTLVERDREAAAGLRRSAGELDASNVRVVEADALSWLLETDQRFDIVFLDPPFDAGLLRPTLDTLAQTLCLASRALIYIEQDASATVPSLPLGWSFLKTKRAGRVSYCLAQSGASA